MVIKRAKSIAEYAILKWLENEGFDMEHFTLEMGMPYEAIIRDASGESLRLEYDPADKSVTAWV